MLDFQVLLSFDELLGRQFLPLAGGRLLRDPLAVRAHVRSDIHNGGGSSSQGSLQSSAAQSQQRTDSSSDDSASERSVSAAPKKRSRGGKRVVPSPLYTEDRRSDEDIADEFLTFAQTDELHAMYQEVVVGNSTCISSTADSLPAMSTTATSDPRCVAMVATPSPRACQPRRCHCRRQHLS